MIPDIIERNLSHKIAKNESICFKQAFALMLDLKQLAECAIEKAWRESHAQSGFEC